MLRIMRLRESAAGVYPAHFYAGDCHLPLGRCVIRLKIVDGLFKPRLARIECRT